MSLVSGLDKHDSPSTRQLTKDRQNQTLQEPSTLTSIVANVLFCLTCPVSIFNTCVAPETRKAYVPVNPNNPGSNQAIQYDYIVTRFGIPIEILREQSRGNNMAPPVYCYNPIGLELREVSLGRRYHTLWSIELLDKEATPVVVSATYYYQVVDALQATYVTEDLISFLNKQARSVLEQVVAQYVFSGTSFPSAINTKLKTTLKEAVDFIGVQINSFIISYSGYPERMEKYYMARQIAQAKVIAAKKIAEGAAGVVEQTVEAYRKQNKELTEQDEKALAIHLLYAINNTDETDLKINLQ